MDQRARPVAGGVLLVAENYRSIVIVAWLLICDLVPIGMVIDLRVIGYGRTCEGNGYVCRYVAQ